jgi:hypothetical protein
MPDLPSANNHWARRNFRAHFSGHGMPEARTDSFSAGVGNIAGCDHRKASSAMLRARRSEVGRKYKGTPRI